MTFRSATAFAAAALSTAALLVAPATAHAETALPFGTPTLTSLGITSQIQDMVLARGRVWVSTGNEVDVFSTAGTRLATITGLLGAEDLLASTDGTQVYAALSQDSRIVTLNASSMTQTASWPTSACPSHLALAAGRLFYSYDCAEFAGAISSLSLSDGSAGPVASQGYYTPPILLGSGGVLVATARGLSQSAVNSFTANADGTVTTLATATVDYNNDLALSPDGSQMIITGNSLVARYRTADMSTAGTFATSTPSFPAAIAYSPDGSHLAAAISSGYADMVRVFSATSGSLTSHSAQYHDNSAANPSIESGTLRFSADGTLLYGIATNYQGVAQLVTTTAQSVSTTSLTATVTNPTGYGKAATVRISAPARPGTRVYVVVPTLGTATKTFAGTTDSHGTAVIHPTSPISGPVTVSIPGALRQASQTVYRSVKVPARLGLTPKGYYSASGGIRHYHSIGAVYLGITALPKRQLTLHLVLQARVGKSWTTRSTGTFLSANDGSGYIYLKSANKHVPYRVLLSFAGDQYNAKAPTVISSTFTID